ncbi:MAG: protein kinase, partial [Planctomycetaceae bacterium]|nr:protein kinase [Planctomycetaceae bacterium]
APEIELYAQFWKENTLQLLQPLFVEEFKNLWKIGQTISVETYLEKHPNYAHEKTLLLELLEHELRNDQNDPNPNQLAKRFPQLHHDEVQHVVEQTLFYKVWHKDEKKTQPQTQPQTQTPPADTTDFVLETAAPEIEPIATENFLTNTPQPEPAATENFAPNVSPNVSPETEPKQNENVTEIFGLTTDFSNQNVNATESFELNSNLNPIQQPDSHSSTNNNWGEQKASSVNWNNESIKSTMDFIEDQYHAAVNDFTVTLQKQPTAAPPPKSVTQPKKAKLKPYDHFNVRDYLEVTGYIGSGAWKDVYKARQQSTQQLVAFKHLREKNEKECEALLREVRTQAKLTHQNIPPVFAFDKLDNGEAIVVEKLVDGSRWSDSMSQRSLDDNLRILLEVGQAIAYAHRRHQIIHRDLKPDNVVINDAFDEVYVIDWGLAVSVTPQPNKDDYCPHISEVCGVAGTPLYWSPEMATGNLRLFSTASDVFLLGALLYEILTQHPPYAVVNHVTTVNNLIAVNNVTDANNVAVKNSSENVSEINENFKTAQQELSNGFVEVGPMLRAIRGVVCPPKLRAPEQFIPDELAVIAMQAMSPDPKQRYADGSEFVDAIKRYQHHAEAAQRGITAWKSLAHVAAEIKSAQKNNKKLLHPQTLRLIEIADTFHQVNIALDGENVLRKNGAQHQNLFANPLLATAHSALTGELDARRQLFDLTLLTGDLALATSQIDLMTAHPFITTEELQNRRREVKKRLTSRRRGKAMKWVAAALLLAFLGASILYGYLINAQYLKTETERQRAEANFQSAREVVNQFLTDFAKDESLKNLGLMPLQRKLLDSAKEYYEIFVAQKSDDPQVLFEQMHALFDIAGIETRFGNRQDVADYFQRAINIGIQLTAKQPQNPQHLDLLAKCYKDLGVYYQMIEFDPKMIKEVNSKALTISRQLANQYPENLEYQRNFARILHNLGEHLARSVPNTTPDSETFLNAEKNYRESLEVRQRLQEKEPEEFLFGTAQTSLALAALHLEEAKNIEQEGKNRSDSLNESNSTKRSKDQLNELNKLAGQLLQRINEANLELKTALNLITTLKNDYPDDFGITKEFLQALIQFKQSEVRRLEKRFDVAETNIQDAIQIFESIVKRAPEDMAFQGRLNEATILLYEILTDEEKLQDQIELCKLRIKDFENAIVKYPEIADYIILGGAWYNRLAETLHYSGNSEDAEKLLRQIIQKTSQQSETDSTSSATKNIDKLIAAQRTLDSFYSLLFDFLYDNEKHEEKLALAVQRSNDLETLLKNCSEIPSFYLYRANWSINQAESLTKFRRNDEAQKLLENEILKLNELPEKLKLKIPQLKEIIMRLE